MNEVNTTSATGVRQAEPPRPDRPMGWLREEINRLFDDLPFATTPRGLFHFARGSRRTSPAMELVEHDGGYRMAVELPGIEAKDIDIELADGILTVSGQKACQSESERDGYLISERDYGAFRRAVSLPGDVDADSLKAKLENGVLQIDMKRSKNAPDRSRKIALS